MDNQSNDNIAERREQLIDLKNKIQNAEFKTEEELSNYMNKEGIPTDVINTENEQLESTRIIQAQLMPEENVQEIAKENVKVRRLEKPNAFVQSGLLSIICILLSLVLSLLLFIKK